MIVDEFTELCLRWEWDQVLLEPSTWRSELDGQPLDLLFVESAWKGNGGSWQYQLTGTKAPSRELQALVSHCRDAGVPTVFWNKEDPVHFEDFLDAARLFDWVLTTEQDCVGRYKEALGHDRVDVMPFAAAAWIHNPIRMAGPPDRDIAFAGMYYRHRFPERRLQMDLLLGAAQAVSHRMPGGLEVFSRFHGGDERYQFPDEIAGRVKGSLSYRQMLSAYREFKVFLNVSSVPDSATMCPRRLFEISAAATPVVSTPTPAIRTFFGPEEMVTVRSAEEAEWTLRGLVRNDEWRERLGHRASRRVLSEHTYRHRIDRVLELTGLPEQTSALPSVSVVASTNRPHQLEHVLASVAAQADCEPQLVLVTHGFRAPSDAHDKASERGLQHVEIVEAGGDLTLGACLNLGIDIADGELIAKMDDDDLYGPHYLADLRRALDYSGATVVGKQAHHMFLVGSQALIVRFPEREHRFTNLVMGPTLMTRRETLKGIPFSDRSTGEDTDFLERVLEAGGLIYSSDRYNFVQMRGAQRHTWEVSDLELLANGEVVAYGARESHAFV